MLALLAGPSAAQDDGLRLDELMAGMASATGVVAEFDERKEIALLRAPLESRGRLYFVPPDRLARFTTEPGHASLVVDGDSLRFREGLAGDEIDISGSPMARVFVDNFIVLFSGDLERLEALYTPDLTASGESWRLSLRPRHAPLDRFIEKIVLAGEGPAIARMEVYEQDGDLTTTSFGAVVTDRAFAPEELERLFGEGRPLAGAAGAP
jgi:outer membrane lipoprotein-sorting protein